MKPIEQLNSNLQTAIENFEFPFWENGEENAYTGKMRMTGFRSDNRVDLVFETFEYTLNENLIQTLVYHFSSEIIADFVISVDWLETIHISFDDTVILEDFSFDLDKSQIRSINITEEQKLERAEISPESILFHIVDTVPDSNLFCDFTYLKEVLGINESTLVFSTSNWEHPNFENIMIDEDKSIFDYPDIVMALEALDKNTKPTFLQVPNTSWRLHYL